MMRNLPCLLISLLLTLSAAHAGIIVGHDTTIIAMDKVPLINGNKDSTISVAFPDTSFKYEKILMSYSLSKPAAGWDPYDRVAEVSITKNGETFEIARIMTPFSKACGWTVDVTDFRPVLAGTVDLTAFILYYVTAGSQQGYLVSISFQFIGGNPKKEAFKIQNLWTNNVVNNRWEYGCYLHPIENNIPSRQIVIDHQADSVKVNVNCTGHGQFNTNNCAEFCLKEHTLRVDSTYDYRHDLWRTGCNANTCSPQSGTWTYDRAGWCPGADVIPWLVDITAYAHHGSTIWLQYFPEEYHNYCSPDDSTCPTNVSANCAPGGSSSCSYTGGHTQPFLLMQAQIIFYHNLAVPSGLNKFSGIKNIDVFPNPATESVRISGINSGHKEIIIELYNLFGEKIYVTSVAPDKLKEGVDISLKNFAKGFYTLKVGSDNEFTRKKIIIN